MKFVTAASMAILLATPAMAQQHAPPSEVLAVHDHVAAVSADRIEADIRTLAEFGTRHTLSETESDTRGIGAARRWIFDEFERISTDCGGCLEVMYVSDMISGERRIPEPVEVVSVIAIQRGRIDPDRYVMMSGDIDSRVTDPLDGTSDSPGANDNASGMAGVIEAARVLSQHEFDGSIIYAGLSGEEQGLFGGQIVAAHAIENGWRIKGVLNNDMIGNIAGINGVINNTTARVFSEGTRAVETPEEARIRRFTGGEVDSPSRNLARFVDRTADQYIPNLDVMMVYRLDRFGRGGHHRPFNAVGYPGVRIMETNEHYDRQHQDLRSEDGRPYGDTIDGVDFDHAARLTALNIAVMAQMAGAPPFPSNVTVEGAVQPSTTLSWNMADGPEAANLAGYRVYWRLTDQPQWQWSRFVGLTDTFTLENVVIDNYYFGVSAVALDGSETPVVFPGPAGSFGN
ncbi:peptidase M28 [Maricaulis sp. W15]|uniref:M28 family metallopeptidase n=1 Tax=Maricaulis sp. W15 TaxID=1772333 RepID=UPI000948EEF7|nr:M28 family metallopeptidase [Maricaulis sp. W15]OLF77888.1 peptidase M28 [Maricaulis sp. W15]